MVRDPALAPDGHRKIDWAADHSPVLNTVRDKYLKDGAFEGLGVGVALMLELGNRRVRSAEDIIEAIDLPVLATIGSTLPPPTLGETLKSFFPFRRKPAAA